MLAEKPTARERPVDEEAVRPADGVRIGEAAALDHDDAQRIQKVTTDDVHDGKARRSDGTRRGRRRRDHRLARLVSRAELHVPQIGPSERQVIGVPGSPHAREPLEARIQIRGEPQS